MARFKKGSYKVRCDITGAIVNATRCRKTWDGLFVIKEAWSPRQPQDILAITEETRTPANPRPGGADTFILATDVTSEDL